MNRRDIKDRILFQLALIPIVFGTAFVVIDVIPLWAGLLCVMVGLGFLYSAWKNKDTTL